MIIRKPFSQPAQKQNIHTIALVFFCLLVFFTDTTVAIQIDNLGINTGHNRESNSDQTEDPLEDFNRAMFGVHSLLDGLFLTPLSELYELLVHPFARDRVHSALQNLGTPVIFLNDCLQGEGELAGESATRFLLNSTFGLLGLYDVAAEGGSIHHHQSDFGQTMAVHGAESGAYIFIPLLGPSTSRDLAGTIIDFIVDPVNHVIRHHGRKGGVYLRTVMDGINQRSRVLPITRRLEKAADPYSSYHVLYIQNREFTIKNGQVDRDTPTPDLDE